MLPCWTVTFGSTPSVDAGSPTLWHLARDQAARRPDAAAIQMAGGAPTTYAQLLALCEAVESGLRRRDIGRTDLVAVVIGNAATMASAFVAVSASAVCVVVEPGWHVAEMTRYARRLALRAVVVDANLDIDVSRWAHRLGIPCLLLARNSSGILSVADAERDIRPAGSTDPPGPGDAALLLATSGTTAEPKIVTLTHENILAGAGATVSAYGLTAADSRLNIMSLTHVQGLVGTTTGTLLSGGRLVCTPGPWEPRRFPGWLDAESPTWFSATPPMHRQIIDAAADMGVRLRGTTLRFVRSGSGPLSAEVRAMLEDAYDVPIVESYGMTEAPQTSSTLVDPAGRRRGTVGQGTGCELAVLREDGVVARTGTGELLVRGRNVTPGYYGDAEATRRAFHDGWFRTGDLGGIDADGFVSVAGRLKEIINRGGDKISPEEVDWILGMHPAVAEAVAFGVPDPELGEALAVAVVTVPDRTVTAAELRGFVAQRSTQLKVPTHVRFVGEIPRTRNGKPRRQLLAAEFSALPGRGEQHHTPPGSGPHDSSPLSLVLDAFRDALPDRAVGPDDTFLDLGGNSIVATRLIASLRSRFRIEVSIQVLLSAAGTPREVTDLVSRDTATD